MDAAQNSEEFSKKDVGVGVARQKTTLACRPVGSPLLVSSQRAIVTVPLSAINQCSAKAVRSIATMNQDVSAGVAWRDYCSEDRTPEAGCQSS
eukprot:2987466-Rhodomonas_salina.1